MKKSSVRRVSMGIAVVATASMILAACGTGPGSTNNGDQSLRMFSYEANETVDLLKTQLKQFTSETGIKVTLDTLPGSGAALYPDKLRTELLGGHGPDVFRIWGGQIGGPFTAAGQVASLDKYYKQYGWDKLISPNTVAGMTYDGVKYGLPLWSAYMAGWYSKVAFEKAGVDIPTTYAELETVNEKLKQAGYVPAGLAGKFGWDIMRLFEYLLETTAGPELHEKLLSGEASWDSPEVVKAFELFKKWEDKGWLPEGALGLDPTDIEPGYTQGKNGYTITGAWTESQFINSTPDPTQYGTFLLPTDHKPNRNSGFVEGYMISNSSQNKDNAAKLLNFLAQPAQQIALHNSQSPVAGAEPDPTKFPLSVENGKMSQENPFFTVMDQAFPKAVADNYFQVQSDILQGNIDAKEAATQMQKFVSDWAKSKK